MLTLALAPIAPPLDHAPAADEFSAEEYARWQSITHPKRRAEFCAGHRLLRLLTRAMAPSLTFDPDKARWAQPPQSAPLLPAQPTLGFGLSHSAGWVLAGMHQADPEVNANGASPGIDIELERPRPRLAQLAAYSFGQEWVAQQGSALAPAFFQRWTRCEALVKAGPLTLGTRLLRHQDFHDQPGQGERYMGYSGQLSLGENTLHLSLALAGHCPAPVLLQFNPDTQELEPVRCQWQAWWA